MAEETDVAEAGATESISFSMVDNSESNASAGVFCVEASSFPSDDSCSSAIVSLVVNPPKPQLPSALVLSR